MNPEIKKVLKVALPTLAVLTVLGGIVDRADQSPKLNSSRPSTPPARSWTPLSDAGIGMTPEQINALPSDPAVDESHYIGLCLQSDYRVSIDQSWLTSLVSPSSAEAAESVKTPAEVVSCLKSNQLLIDFVSKNLGVDLNTITEADVVGESAYKDLPKFLADKKLMTLDEAKATFGNTVSMTFKVGEVISSGDATMLDNEADVKSRRANGEKMLFSTSEPYEVVLKNGVKLVFRQDCINLLLLKNQKIKEVSSPTSTGTATATGTAKVIETGVIPSSTPKTPDTATAISTATPPVPSSTAGATETNTPPVPTATQRPTIVPQTPIATATMGVGPTETQQPIATVYPTNTPETPVPTSIATTQPTIVPQTAIPTVTIGVPPATETPQPIATVYPTSPAATPMATAVIVNTPRPTMPAGGH